MIFDAAAAQPTTADTITGIIVVVVIVLLVMFIPDIIRWFDKFLYKKRLQKMPQSDLWTYVCSIADPVTVAHDEFFYNRLDGRIYFRGILYWKSKSKLVHELQALDIPADEFIKVCQEENITLSKSIQKLWNFESSSMNEEDEDDV